MLFASAEIKAVHSNVAVVWLPVPVPASKKNADDLLKQGADLVGVGKVGIGYPDWAKEVMKEEYDPKKPPFTSKQLKEVQLSDVFIDYMRKWDGFVTD